MSRLKRITIILLLISLTSSPLLLTTSIKGSTSLNATLYSSGVIRSSGSNITYILGSCTPSSVFYPGASNYHSNAGDIFDYMNFNTIRIFIGNEGNVWHTSMKTYAADDAWADGLLNLINAVKAMGLRFYFYSLGDIWDGELGILEPNNINVGQRSDLVGVDSVATVKGYINKLAGANKYNYNFLTDPTIVMWNVANEAYIGTVDSAGVFHGNNNLNWIIEVSDYIRSKGGKVAVPCPIVTTPSSSWNVEFKYTAPPLYGHVDYLDNHLYDVWMLDDAPYNINGVINWDLWETNVVIPSMQDMVNHKGSYTMDQLLIDEFGMWRGSGSGEGLSRTNTDDERREYYTHWFDAVRTVGIPNILFHYSIRDMYDGAPDYAAYSTAGTPYLYVADIVKQSFTP